MQTTTKNKGGAGCLVIIVIIVLVAIFHKGEQQNGSTGNTPANQSQSNRVIDPDKVQAIKEVVATDEKIHKAFSSLSESEYDNFMKKNIVPQRLQYPDPDINQVFIQTLIARKKEAKTIHDRKVQLKNAEQELGPKPQNSAWDGSVRCVKEYLEQTLDDPSSVEYVSWSAVYVENINGMKSWAVRVKYRAKNALGAYVLKDEIALIKDNQVQVMMTN